MSDEVVPKDDVKPDLTDSFRGPTSESVVGNKHYMQLLEKRDQAAKAEQALEDEIFNQQAVRSETEIAALITQYRRLKDRRTEASLKAAEAFMRLSPEERGAATKEWKGSEEGQRKLTGSGIRGEPTTENNQEQKSNEIKEDEDKKESL
jgi:hypothetical protein